MTNFKENVEQTVRDIVTAAGPNPNADALATKVSEAVGNLAGDLEGQTMALAQRVTELEQTLSSAAGPKEEPAPAATEPPATEPPATEPPASDTLTGSAQADTAGADTVTGATATAA